MPSVLPLFPLDGALLLPRRPIQLTVFEPRYLEMLDDALAGERLIGVIQPIAGDDADAKSPELFPVGCAGRIVQYAEIGDKRCFLTLMGVARFRVASELRGQDALSLGRPRLFRLRRRLHRGRGPERGRPQGAGRRAARLRRGQRGRRRLGRHREGVERDAGQRAGDDEPLRRQGEAGAAGGARPQVARRDPGGDLAGRARPQPRRAAASA